MNAQVGRFQIPVGESYLRYSKGDRDNPFITNTVGGTWWWDEGVKLYGSDARNRFGYVASLTDGETPQDWGLDDGDQFTLKLFVNPTSWLYLSTSVLYSGAMGDDENPAQAALWLGETWATGFGANTGSPSWVDGRIVPAGPGRLDHTLYLGADAVLTHPAGGAALALLRELRDRLARREPLRPPPPLLDRRAGARGPAGVARAAPFYVAVRANGLGTYDDDEGYVLDIRTTTRSATTCARSTPTRSCSAGT